MQQKLNFHNKSTSRHLQIISFMHVDFSESWKAFSNNMNLLDFSTGFKAKTLSYQWQSTMALSMHSLPSIIERVDFALSRRLRLAVWDAADSLIISWEFFFSSFLRRRQKMIWMQNWLPTQSRNFHCACWKSCRSAVNWDFPVSSPKLIPKRRRHKKRFQFYCFLRLFGR